MDLERLVGSKGGILHRHRAENAGFPTRVQRQAVASGSVRIIRRQWLATPDADPALVSAAENGGRLTCVSLARRRGWWMPEPADPRLHLAMKAHARTPGAGFHGVAHWSKPVAPAPPWSLVDCEENALAHLAVCLPRESALVVWESAIRAEGLAADALRRITWTSRAARECADSVAGLSDSGLETLLVVRLSPWGLPMRQQALIAGHRVDLLIGDRLVIQIDGWAHHSTAAQRGRDVTLDAELVLRGYTVLRFMYAQIVHDWPKVERTIARAVAMGAHLAT